MASSDQPGTDASRDWRPPWAALLALLAGLANTTFAAALLRFWGTTYLAGYAHGLQLPTDLLDYPDPTVLYASSAAISLALAFAAQLSIPLVLVAATWYALRERQRRLSTKKDRGGHEQGVAGAPDATATGIAKTPEVPAADDGQRAKDQQLLMLIFLGVLGALFAVGAAAAITLGTFNLGKRAGTTAAGDCHPIAARDSVSTTNGTRTVGRQAAPPDTVAYCARFGDHMVLRIRDSLAVVPREQFKVLVFPK